MEEDREEKRGIRAALFLPGFVCMLLALAGICGVAWYEDIPQDAALGCMVMAALGMALSSFCIRKEYLDGELHYDNGEHLLRFWLGMAGGIAVCLACVFLPAEGWPFLPIFVMLALFSSPTAGTTASIVLLMIPSMLSGAAVGVFFLYLLNGLFGVLLFSRIEKEVKIGIPLFLSMFSLLVCETANRILIANKRPAPEDFVVPVVNLILSCVLLLGLIKVFSAQVVYPFRVPYLEINDTENPILVTCRQEDKETYFHSVHTAHFCERIAAKLSMDVDAVKCAAYYHKIVEKDPSVLSAQKFPPGAVRVLREYVDRNRRKGAVWQKETVVLLCADEIIRRITALLQENGDETPDYDRVIDGVFQELDERNVFLDSDLTLRELASMRRMFKEEKLYYDFLR